jgi:hypothetical protein
MLLARWEALSCLMPALCPVAVEAPPLTLLCSGAIDVPSVQNDGIPQERREAACGEAMGPTEVKPPDHI